MKDVPCLVLARSAHSRPFTAVRIWFAGVLFGLLFGIHQARATLLYYTDFENFTVGNDTWVGTDGWLGNSKGLGVHGIDSNIVVGLGKTAFLGYRQPSSTFVAVLKPVNYLPLTSGKPVIEFETLMGIQDSTNGHRDSFFFSFYNTNGNFLASIRFSNEPLTFGLWRLDGTNQVDTGIDFVRNELHLLYASIDFATNRWSADLDGIPLFSNAVFNATGRPLTLGSISAEWQLASTSTTNHGDNWMLVADWSVRALSKGETPFLVRGVGRNGSGKPTVSWNGESGFDYWVSYADYGNPWLTNLTGSAYVSNLLTGTLTFTDPSSPVATNRWYRLTRQPTP